jgi:hypothetical protein
VDVIVKNLGVMIENDIPKYLYTWQTKERKYIEEWCDEII